MYKVGCHKGIHDTQLSWCHSFSYLKMGIHSCTFVYTVANCSITVVHGYTVISQLSTVLHWSEFSATSYLLVKLHIITLIVTRQVIDVPTLHHDYSNEKLLYDVGTHYNIA